MDGPRFMLRRLLVCSALVSASLAAEITRRATVIPTDLGGAWAYQGCWTDVGRTLDAAGYTNNTGMTVESCVAFCGVRGYQYAGVEYYQECYCGSSLKTGAVNTTASSCNAPCTGNSSEACGGSGVLSLYYSSAPVGPQTNPGVGGWDYVGCISEGTTGRALTYAVPGATIAGSAMTVALCVAACQQAGYILAGVEYASQCYCDNAIKNGGALASSGCTMVCNGNSSEICGGPSLLDLYDYKMEYSLPWTVSGSTQSSTQSVASGISTAVTTPSTPATPYQPGTVDSVWTWYGCQTEGTNARALSSKTFAADTMTLESCATFCSGYMYFGVEYARECYCGNSFSQGSVAAPATDCSFTCAGNGTELCGAGNRLSVYSSNGATQPSSSVGAGSSSTASTVVSVPTGMPAGWTYQGCWIDGLNGRILQVQQPDSQTNTQEGCAQKCAAAGYSISGTEYGVQCFCGNAIYNGGAKTVDSDCSTPCPGNANEDCGAGNRLSIYANGTPAIFQPPAAWPGNANWTYQGCIQDAINGQRTFFWQLFFPNVMTPLMCLDKCAAYGYMAAGLEYGDECYCGDPGDVATAGAQKVADSQCNVICAGNASAYCGGGSLLSTYFWTGTPLHSFTYAQGTAAGEYQFLIGGVTVPLMTIQSVTGKVSFLSKWGTGPANETGAYELDLSVLDNFAEAWRPLHVKTDVFCSAGIVLPDLGGRQLNVGGWSGESTFGCRLYWPDGSPGVWGTHDWQENVDELTLQVGRWYPSAMVLSNGSVMVIGGEVGSNSAAVPSIEILPPTGTAPLYMDWLERTNPNNLYPFVCILPGGGIFVAYWNEARILDQSTFETVKILPNMTGAVNDDTAGRTYPMEGAAVPLPQHAPYTDPLEILICGGSTLGVANALDNCVLTTPEAENPTWTLERLPSFRVMPCIAPLPDGTYLIANGAHHGVAGFGLATGPNLNALLYDPSKPIGSRITVMANTTVARLYHSEAITLLDGRVLISGSDPEDGVNPEEYRVEVFVPPYLLNGKPRPSYTIAEAQRDWAYGQTYTFTLGGPSVNAGGISVTLLGAVGSTHGNSMGARTLMPAFSCNGLSCTVTAPPNAHICPPGWYQLHVLDGGVPAIAVFVRIGGDPAALGNWPAYSDFITPGVGTL
ncbi:galactose oxidase [Thozetella sp. PMI_491]|nr:galactose oxidase [Thozetella sp. PMI_491]